MKIKIDKVDGNVAVFDATTGETLSNRIPFQHEDELQAARPGTMLRLFLFDLPIHYDWAKQCVAGADVLVDVVSNGWIA